MKPCGMSRQPKSFVRSDGERMTAVVVHSFVAPDLGDRSKGSHNAKIDNTFNIAVVSI